MKYKLLLLTLLAMILLSACGASPLTSDPLNDTSWKLFASASTARSKVRLSRLRLKMDKSVAIAAAIRMAVNFKLAGGRSSSGQYGQQLWHVQIHH